MNAKLSNIASNLPGISQDFKKHAATLDCRIAELEREIEDIRIRFKLMVYEEWTEKEYLEAFKKASTKL